ncbi:MAG TPA: hypothetical protein VLA36_14975 [Longimicrobiales bacterium]|nr:hypothetical protein [Longimicrobiales bacterium]
MRTLTLGLIGAAALAAGILLVRQTREPEETASRVREDPAGETTQGVISLDRIRALGL